MRLLSAFSLVALVLGACTNDNDTDNSSNSRSYNGPGSEWTLSKSGTTYTLGMTDGATSLSVTATGTALATGHTKLTVTSATASGTTAPSVGDVGHAIEIDGTAVLVKPMSANSETIAMVSAGSCPSANFSANWVIGQRATGAGAQPTKNDSDWFGSIDWNTSTGAATFPRHRSLENPTSSAATGNEGSNQTIGTCSAGKITNGGLKGYFTTSGLVIVVTNDGTTDESHIIGVPQAAIGTASTAHGDYAGFIFDQDANDAFPVTATFGAGTGSAGDLTVTCRSGADLTTTGTTYTAQFNTGNVDSIASGIMHGVFSACAGGGTHNFDNTCEIACAVSKNVNSSGRNLIYCVGQHPTDEDDRVTILLFQKL